MCSAAAGEAEVPKEVQLQKAKEEYDWQRHTLGNDLAQEVLDAYKDGSDGGEGEGIAPDLLLAPAKVPRNCQIWPSDGEYGRDIAILGNSVAAYSDPVA